MNTMKREIHEGAIFIADSHYPHHGDAFLALLKKIQQTDIQPPQLFLMGDNFDLLFGTNEYIQTFSSEAIALLKTLSESLEIHYFEGNHDFVLSEIFTNINVYPREEQPVLFTFDGKTAALAHGDRYETGIGYDIFCALLRNRVTLTLLKPFQKFIIDREMKQLSKKKICKTLDGFEKKTEAILRHYNDVDMVIEGHFHQSKTVGNYVSLPSLACQGTVGVMKEGKIYFQALG